MTSVSEIYCPLDECFNKPASAINIKVNCVNKSSLIMFTTQLAPK